MKIRVVRNQLPDHIASDPTRGEPGKEARDPGERAALEAVGNAIAAYRGEKGLSQTEVAELAGCSAGELEAIEAGKLWASWGALRAITAACGKELAALFVAVQEDPPRPEGGEGR